MGVDKASVMRWIVQMANPTCRISHRATLDLHNRSDLIIGKNVSISHYTYIVSVASENGKDSTLTIGDDVYIGEFNNIRAGGGGVVIGARCMISQHVSIIAVNHSVDPSGKPMPDEYDSTKCGVSIGEGVWIGCNSVILPGVTIGRHAVVGAGSIVTKSIPPNCVVVGNPARIIRSYPNGDLDCEKI
jgi:acetyltransferase-like isoleucine patch superfamily enzyme